MLHIYREEKWRGCSVSYLQPWWKWNSHVPNMMFINNPKVPDTESSLALGLPSAEGMLVWAGTVTVAVFMQKHTNTTENTGCAGSHKTHSALPVSSWIPPTAPSLVFPSLFFFFYFVVVLGFFDLHQGNKHPQPSKRQPWLPRTAGKQGLGFTSWILICGEGSSLGPLLPTPAKGRLPWQHRSSELCSNELGSDSKQFPVLRKRCTAQAEAEHQ